jgi:sulfoxide reductase heme-binding subunit YedZ
VKRKAHFPWLRFTVHVLGWLPLVYLVYAYITNRLTINPIQELEQSLGRTAVTWLVATLAVTPLYTLTGWQDLPKRRRAIGMYAFLYICLHLAVFFGLDYAFNLSQIWNLVSGKFYLMVGVLAMLLLIPLAITSFDYFKRKMGRTWKRLHWLIYPAAIISILHYALAQKGNIFTLRGNIFRPFLWGIAVFLLLALRLPPVRRRVSGIRRHLAVTLHRNAISKKSLSGKGTNGVNPLN